MRLRPGREMMGDLASLGMAEWRLGPRGASGGQMPEAGEALVKPLRRRRQRGAVPGLQGRGGGSWEEDVVSGSGALEGPRKLRTEPGPHEPRRAQGRAGAAGG